MTMEDLLRCERRAHLFKALANPMRIRMLELLGEKPWCVCELAERVGVSRKTVNTVENGVFTPSTPLALGLARALGVKVEQLFWLED